jgi:urease accessory protein
MNKMSIQVNSIIGNVNKDSMLKARYEEMLKRGLCEFVTINRIEAERVRMRKVTDKGTDVIITLPKGSRLKHGDVIVLQDDKMILVQLEPEDVAMVKIRDNTSSDDAIAIAVRVGHVIGNLHKPIKIDQKSKSVYFPIQADTELEMIKKTLTPIIDHLQIEKVKMVFEMDEGGMHVHEH